MTTANEVQSVGSFTLHASGPDAGKIDVEVFRGNNGRYVAELCWDRDDVHADGLVVGIIDVHDLVSELNPLVCDNIREWSSS